MSLLAILLISREIESSINVRDDTLKVTTRIVSRKCKFYVASVLQGVTLCFVVSAQTHHHSHP